MKKVILIIFLTTNLSKTETIIEDFMVNPYYPEKKCEKSAPHIFSLSNNTFVVLWSDIRDGRNDIYYQIYRNDTKYQKNIQLNNPHSECLITGVLYEENDSTINILWGENKEWNIGDRKSGTYIQMLDKNTGNKKGEEIYKGNIEGLSKFTIRNNNLFFLKEKKWWDSVSLYLCITPLLSSEMKEIKISTSSIITPKNICANNKGTIFTIWTETSDTITYIPDICVQPFDISGKPGELFKLTHSDSVKFIKSIAGVLPDNRFVLVYTKENKDSNITSVICQFFNEYGKKEKKLIFSLQLIEKYL